MIKNNVLRLLDYVPAILRARLLSLAFWLRHPTLREAAKAYARSDYALKTTHITEAINYLRVAGNSGSLLPQTYFEFGCHSGRTFSAAVNAGRFLKMDDLVCYAFDSFQGLPRTNKEDGYFKTGTFFTNRQDFVDIVFQKTRTAISEDQIIEGFYDTSLTPKLCGRLPNAGVIHIDVDLYSSTVLVLDFVAPLLVPGTLIIFDDWFSFPIKKESAGERRAFEEFLERNPQITAQPWKSYSTFGQSFFITSGE